MFHKQAIIYASRGHGGNNKSCICVHITHLRSLRLPLVGLLNYAERIDPDVLKIEKSRYVKSILDGSWELIMGYSTFHLRQVARQCLKIFFLATTIAKGKI